MNKRKRVLIINNHSIKENNSTGLTIRSILNYFNFEDILEIFYYPIDDEVKLDELKSIKLRSKTKTLYNLISKVYSGIIKRNVNFKIVEAEIKNKKSYLKKIKKIILAYDDYFEPNLKCNEDIMHMIFEFRPDVIYTLGASIFSLKVAYKISKEYNIPIVLHHMDNWRETLYSNSKILHIPRKKLLQELDHVESRMNFGMAISEKMAIDFEKFSGKKYLSLMHTIENINFVQTDKLDSRTIHLAYAGGLHLERWKMLKEIEKSISEINYRDKKVYLNIYTKNEDRERFKNQFNSNIVRFHDFLPHDKVFKIYESSDILVHVESFDSEIVRFIKYSMSTKIPEYMASGRPILCYAPHEIASSIYIVDSKCGVSVSDYNELLKETRKLIESEDLREKMGKNGINRAIEKHSKIYMAGVMREVFEMEEII